MLALLGIAVADMLVMIEYIPLTVHLNLWTSGRSEAEQFSWSWAAFVWFHVNFSNVIHNVSVGLTLSLAVWRFIMIRLTSLLSASRGTFDYSLALLSRFHTLAPIYCTMTRCKILLLCAYGKEACDIGYYSQL